MKEEEKILLLEDISARLPFGLKFIAKPGMLEMDVINLADKYQVWACKNEDEHNLKLEDFHKATVQELIEHFV